MEKATAAQKPTIKAIMGLGNPGVRYYKTRHSIGYRVVDALAEQFGGDWHDRGVLQMASITINDQPVLLVKSNTFMNDSGKAISYLMQKGIKPEELLVVHDELEKPFGSLVFKIGGSARGHNGLRSIMHVFGDTFMRLRVGIGRPTAKEDVADYVLQPFAQSEDEIHCIINLAVAGIEQLYWTHISNN